MSTILDILGAIVIGGFLLLAIIRMNGTTVESTYVYSADLTVQSNLVAVGGLIEYDFRRIGYCADPSKIPDPSKSILAADSNRIKFLTDVDSDGNVDTVQFYVGPTSELSGTPNPRDRLLYRVVNQEQAKGVNLGVTQLSLQYYDALADLLSFPITVPSAIYTMRISLTIENSAAYNEKYTTAFWRQIRLAARNLRNR